MLEIAIVTFKAFGKIRTKEIVIPSQDSFFSSDYSSLKKFCTDDLACDDFVILNVKFRKVEVFQ